MSKKFMHYCMVFITLVMVVSLFTACTPKAAPAASTEAVAGATDAPVEDSATEVAKDPVTINLWIIDRVGMDAMETVKAVAEQWAAETGNTVVVTEGNQFEMLNKIPQAIPAGEGPDIFMNINNYIGGHYSGQLIVPLESYLSDEEKANYSQNSLDSFTLDGHLLGIPFAGDTMALVYNKALVPSAPTTMDELISMAKPLTQGGQYGFLYQIDSFYYSYPFIAAYGGYIFKWTGTGYDVADIGLANEGAIEGLTYVTDLVNKEKLMPADTTADVMNSLFSEGKVGMIITNPAMVPSYKTAGIDVGVAPIPTTPNGQAPRPFATFTGFSVSSQSKNQDVAADLAIYMGKNLPLPLYQANNGNIPVYKTVAEDPSLQSTPEFDGWVTQLNNSEVLPSINEMNFVWAPATAAFQAAVHGDATVEQSLTDAQALILQTIEENK
ncbi:MAG: maltose ABC transporter substrate-binding protein [Anaerolineaceae bacterium]|jgi:maltose-binding protein MalE